MISPAFVEIREARARLVVMNTPMARHTLGVADLPEPGSKGDVSKILNGADGKRLTRKHMEALGKRFGVSPVLFF